MVSFGIWERLVNGCRSLVFVKIEYGLSHSIAHFYESESNTLRDVLI